MTDRHGASYDYLIHHMLRTSAGRFPDKEALVHVEERLSFEALFRQVSGLAAGLRQAGGQRGDRIGILLEPSVAQTVSIFAISLAGGVFVPINHQLFPNQAAHIARDCRMKGLITTRARLAALEPEHEALGALEWVVLLDGEGEVVGPWPHQSFEAFCGLPPLGSRCEAPTENDLAALLYTSGSTGKPKGVMCTHAQVMAGSKIVSTYLGITSKERILAALPFSFDAGLNQLMTAAQQGATIVLANFVFARQLVQLFANERITGMVGVPTLWNLLVQPRSTLDSQPLPELRYLANTGGRMPQTVLAKLRALLPQTQIFLMYGLTEAFRSTYLPPEELDRRPTSIGKAIPNSEIILINAEGKPGKPGEPCELVHRGPTVSLGYWGQPELTARVLRPHPFLEEELGESELVCYSGDLVERDEEGFLYFIGRRDAMIKTSGYRVSPTEVEEVLYQFEGIKEAAVIGVPDDALGYAIKALIVKKDKDGAEVDVPALLAFCGEKMPRHMVPALVEFLDALPKTPNGKVDYPTLRRREGATLI